MGQVVHVIPINDLREHPMGSDVACPCQPETQLVDGGRVVLHHAWDKRELRERKAQR